MKKALIVMATIYVVPMIVFLIWIVRNYRKAKKMDHDDWKGI
ncbi:hypothetical protein [Arachidicoccus terrestris]|nr:hypothetical protein [Arachidicoccus terrestris]